MASTLDDTQARAFPAGGFDSGATFDRAMRHSRRVRVLRIAVPATIALVVAAVALASYLDPLRLLAARLPVESAGVVISGSKITMAQPKLSGYTRDARAYEFTAAAAAQDVTKPDLVELQSIRAKVEAKDKTTLDLSAVDGVFDRKSGVLKLNRDIRLTSTSGLEVRLIEAVVETGSGNIVSEKPVEVQMPQGALRADRLEVTGAGEVVRFDGNVVMNLVPGEEKKQ